MGLYGLPFGGAPQGAVDGANTVFALPCTPLLFTLAFYKNGVFQVQGADYTIFRDHVTCTTAPAVGDTLYAQGIY